MAKETPTKPSDQIKYEGILKGQIIKDHLENVNMEPWYFIYQFYVNPPEIED